jgi:hypothetical protein
MKVGTLREVVSGKSVVSGFSWLRRGQTSRARADLPIVVLRNSCGEPAL